MNPRSEGVAGGTFVKLDAEISDILCCALCKGPLEWQVEQFACADCGTRFPRETLSQRDSKEHVYDFRIRRPAYCLPQGAVFWDRVQGNFEDDDRWHSSVDDLHTYLAEIESVKEIYTEQFAIRGRILDVGGHQGRLRLSWRLTTCLCTSRSIRILTPLGTLVRAPIC